MLEGLKLFVFVENKLRDGNHTFIQSSQNHQWPNMFNLPEGATFLLLGASLHVLALRKGEWDLTVFKILTTAAAAPLAIALCQISLQGVTLSSALWRSCYLVGSVTVGMYLSMVVYRVGFHRLNRFPGPFLARISNFYITGVAFRRHQEYSELEKLHKQYGDVVRIGE